MEIYFGYRVVKDGETWWSS